jgi:hypothetical protein
MGTVLLYHFCLWLLVIAAVVVYDDDGLREAFRRLFVSPFSWVFGGRSRRRSRR